MFTSILISFFAIVINNEMLTGLGQASSDHRHFVRVREPHCW